VAQSFQCTLVTPECQLLDEQVTYASIPAIDGQIGLMPGRAPLLVKLGDGALRLDITSSSGGSDPKVRQFFIGGGFAQMKDNVLCLVANEAVAEEDVNTDEAEAALKEATTTVTQSDDAFTTNQRKQICARTMLQLKRH